MTTRKMLINATQVEEIRVAIIENNLLCDLDIEASARLQKKSNIYKARVSRIEPSLDAIFVDYGAERHGFLPMKELAPEYLPSGGDVRAHIREGQEIIIQIDKEERGTKGAAVTTFITLAGCYLVLMPNNQRAGGVSRRIEGDDRQQLKNLITNLIVPEKMGVIARTACLGRSAEELQWDLDTLLKLWDNIKQEASKHAAPFLIYQESDVILRSVRDYLRQDIDEIMVDDRKTFERVQEYVKRLRPDFLDRVHFYHHDIGIFTYYRIESQIETAYQREIKLPSGGSIVIDHTEALTSIDINSSRATKGGDIEETALNTNLEAAREIARQFKLRDLGGLIVIDFIDMTNPKNQREVETCLTEATKNDRARIQIGKISRFGLLEMSRQRLRSSLEESSGHVCPRCNGQGSIRGVESLALSLVRIIQEEALRADTLEVQVQLPIVVATFLLNEKRYSLSQIETQNKVRITLIPNSNLETPHYELTKITKNQDEMIPSYSIKPIPAKEERMHSSRKVSPLEEPAIRDLKITAAPSKSPMKRTLNKLIQRLQKAFKPEAPKAVSPQVKQVISPTTARRRNTTLSANTKREENISQTNKRRNYRDGETRERNTNRRNAPATRRPVTASNPAASTPQPRREIKIEELRVVPATPVATLDNKVNKISPAVQQILAHELSTTPSQQVETAASNTTPRAKNSKMPKEEVLFNTEFISPAESVAIASAPIEQVETKLEIKPANSRLDIAIEEVK